jgi:glycosyltransferase involved in cell wall biosynthesis
MAYVDGESTLIRDTPEGFAEAVVMLLSKESVWKQIQLGALRVARECYAWERHIARLEEIYYGQT